MTGAATGAGSGSGSYVDVGGLQLYYDDVGSGPPVVLLHGGLLTVELTFGRLVAALAERHRVIAPELQGHGHTADTDRDLSVATFADDVVILLDHLGIDRADVVGLSLGGLVALSLATSRPERVRRLVVVSAPYDGSGWRPSEELGPDESPTPADGDVWRAAYRAVAPDPDHFDDFVPRLSAMVAQPLSWPEAEVAAVEAPTLVMVGDRDFVSVEHAAAMARLLPHGRLAVFPDTTHVGMTKRDDLMTAMVVPFLDEPG